MRRTNMTIATHLIKIKGTVKDGKKREDEIKKYVKDKIHNEIDSIFHPDLELFRIDDDNNVDVWVYVCGLVGSIKYIVEKWLKNHITEEGIDVKNFDIEELKNEKFFVNII